MDKLFADNIHADWTRLDPYVDCAAVAKLREVSSLLIRNILLWCVLRNIP
jgi:hypothetical protein